MPPPQCDPIPPPCEQLLIHKRPDHPTLKLYRQHPVTGMAAFTYVLYPYYLVTCFEVQQPSRVLMSLSHAVALKSRFSAHVESPITYTLSVSMLLLRLAGPVNSPRRQACDRQNDLLRYALLLRFARDYLVQVPLFIPKVSVRTPASFKV